ncbi:hypothetical protein DBR32_00545 [Taibaiella sp. KBW10]|uniref:hypothetical protein n=1 Tax=Taibaiella sp. KBW10 TaxID=2153357 RepID=UPI000F5AC9B7|nr:hypothetical protein [Taibaiella sp. KBW10]RQO32136.1 hypothetical protein DBR32_00545 [Taibaiella sp. KBW10]
MHTNITLTLLNYLSLSANRHFLDIAYTTDIPPAKDEHITRFTITDSEGASVLINNKHFRNQMDQASTAGNFMIEITGALDWEADYSLTAIGSGKDNILFTALPIKIPAAITDIHSAGKQPLLVTLDNTSQETPEEETDILWERITKSTIVFNEHLSKYLDAVYINKDKLADRFNLQMYANNGTQDYQVLKIAVKKYIETRMFNDDVGGYFKGGPNSPMLQKSSIGAETITGSLTTSDDAVSILNDMLGETVSEQGTAFNKTESRTPFTTKNHGNYKNYQFVELIYCYWMIVGGLEKGMNMVASRFINSGNGALLGRFDINALNSVSTLLYGFIQDKKLSIDNQVKQNEILHAYGLSLNPNGSASAYHPDNRVKFISSFHALLNKCSIFIKENDDLTRKPDAFKIYIHLKELNFILLDGYHNAYQEVNVNLRVEHIMQQYLLSRSEMREFLGGKQMLPYSARYIDRVDTLRNLQGQDSCFQHFDNLAELGEVLLLSIRYGNWNDNNITEVNAMQWLEYFRTHIQKYLHSYRVVTGIDLSDDNTNSMVSVDPRLLETQPITLINNGRRPQRTFRRY